jgi:C_GCAxxG_C_C family probable redox protein
MNESIRDRVLANFDKGPLLCAETVLKLIAEASGRDPAPFLGVASGFCSGMARTKGECGALAGAVMGIGLVAANGNPAENREKVYELTQEIKDRFIRAFGSTNCHELTGCDFTVPEDQIRFREQGVKENCYEFCTVAVIQALKLLRDSGSLPDRESYIRARLAPCGLSCGHCLAYSGGPVQEAAAKLKQGLGPNFGPYAERFAAMNSVFKDYEGFSRLLDFFETGSCTGCREQGCLFQACKVPECVREHKVDYCFECGEFPCDKHGMPEPLAGRWRANNEKMAEIGVEAWFAGCLARPRYP